MSDFLQITTTTSSEGEAQQIARDLVEQRLVACAHVSGPATSVYRWQGQIEQAAEWLCTLKTRVELFDEVTAAIRKRHSYQCPQIVATPLTAISDDYRAWLEEETSDQS